MTVTEKYLVMNNNFCKLRDAIYECNVEEMEEDEFIQRCVESALSNICNYLDYYKKLNNVHTKPKGD